MESADRRVFDEHRSNGSPIAIKDQIKRLRAFLDALGGETLNLYSTGFQELCLPSFTRNGQAY